MERIFYRPHIDWVLVAALIPLMLAGLITMKNLGGLEGDADYFFNRQLVWIGVGLAAFFLASSLDWRILRNGWVLLLLYFLGLSSLVLLLFLSPEVRGTRSWFSLGLFSLEPAEPMKLISVLVLSKYFSRRHVEIAHVKHIIVSGFYAFLPAFLIFIQPDLGSALIFGVLWLGMILVSGVSKKHLAGVFAVGILAALLAWFYLLAPYQKARISTFLNPFTDPRGAGYNALQSMIAVGSGGIFGRGVGLGSQSRLEFLPEHETDFVFAAFAEEWGFLGVSILFIFFGILFWRILKAGVSGQSNFEKFYALGLLFILFSHLVIHVGMNLGLLPVTGISLPFLSYGGSNLISFLFGLGILMGMRRYSYHSGLTRLDDDFALADVLKKT